MRILRATSISLAFYLTFLIAPGLPTSARADGVDPFAKRAQCVARCCPWDPGADPERYKACLVRFDRLCGPDPDLCKDGPPKPAR